MEFEPAEKDKKPKIEGYVTEEDHTDTMICFIFVAILIFFGCGIILGVGMRGVGYHDGYNALAYNIGHGHQKVVKTDFEDGSWDIQVVTLKGVD